MKDLKIPRQVVYGLLSVDTQIVDDYQFVVYPNFKLPGIAKNEMAIASFGSAPVRSQVLSTWSDGGNWPVVHILIQCNMQYKDDDEFALASDMAEDIEAAIYRVIVEENANNANWRKAVFPQISLRDPYQVGVQNAVSTKILVRVTL